MDHNYNYLNEPYLIGVEQQEQYLQGGCILIKDILDRNQVELFRSHIGNAVEKHFEERKRLQQSDAFYENYIKEKGYQIDDNVLKAGDATFHTGWTIHAASGNDSATRREVMTIIYYEDGAKVLEPDNKNRRVDMETFLHGKNPGEIAASPLNPVLYSDRG